MLDDLDRIPYGLRFVITFGVFDGVHRGHASVLRALVDCAHELRATPVAMTFQPHPEAVVRGAAPPLLCDVTERLSWLERAGAEMVVLQHFDQAFRMQTANEFLDRLGRNRDLAGLVLSGESQFGHDREGTIDTARRRSAAEGWRLIEVLTLELDGERISSGRIRQLIEAGDLAGAARQLGHPYAVIGRAHPVAPRRVEPSAPGAPIRIEPVDPGAPIRLAFADPVALPPPATYPARISWGAEDPLAPEHTVIGDVTMRVAAQAAGSRSAGHAVEVEVEASAAPVAVGQRVRLEFL